MAIMVREAVLDDLSALLPLWEDIHPGLSNLSVEPLESRIAMSTTNENFRVLTAWDADKAVGIALISIAEVGTWVEMPSLQISGLHVHKSSRHRGVAKALLNSALGYADIWGCHNIMASVPPQEREANRFFARLGFAPIATRRICDTAQLRKKISDEPSRMVAQRIRRRSQNLLGGDLRTSRATDK
jgi:GNAT superfamily N-acetyltransferase